jgi:hypothetical protein
MTSVPALGAIVGYRGDRAPRQRVELPRLQVPSRYLQRSRPCSSSRQVIIAPRLIALAREPCLEASPTPRSDFQLADDTFQI